MLDALRIRDFRLLWLGHLLSALGDWLVVIAVPLHVFEVTGSATATALLYAAQNAPAVLVGPHAGVLVDRWDRRRTMVVADATSAALLGGTVAAVLLLPTTVWPVVAAVVAERVLAQFHAPAATALVPGIVGRGGALAAANSSFSAAGAVVRVVGAPVGGALFALGGLAPLLVVDAATFLASLGCVVALRHRPPRPERRPDSTVGAELRVGLRVAAHTPVIRWVVAVMAAFMFCNGAVTGLLVPFVSDHLGAGPTGFGAILASLGVGYLLGAPLAARLGRAVRLHGRTSACLAVVAVGFVALFSARSLTVACLGAVVTGVGGSATLVLAATTIQRAAADRVLGRVSAAANASQQAAQVVGTVAGAGLAAATGVIPALLVWSAALGVVAGAGWLTGRRIVERDVPERSPEGVAAGP